MLYSLLGRLTWGLVKRWLRRRAKPSGRQSLLAALITGIAVAASYRQQGRRRSRR